QLAVYLAAEPSEDSRTKAANPLGSGSVERIVAIGKPVVLDAPSQSAYTEAERLEYNLKTRQVLLKSFNAGAKVHLRRGNDEFRAPELVYEMVQGKRLGNLWAPGPGRLVSSTGEGASQRPFSAEWQKELRIRPDQQNQLISLIGGAKIDGESHGAFQADELHLWVLELPDSSAQQVAARSLPQLLPDRLLATGHVHADSSQLAA